MSDDFFDSGPPVTLEVYQPIPKKMFATVCKTQQPKVEFLTIIWMPALDLGPAGANFMLDRADKSKERLASSPHSDEP